MRPLKDTLKLRIPPLLLAGLFALSMFGLSRFVPGISLAPWIRNLLLGALAGMGVVLCICGVVEFRRQKTTVDPRFPEKASSLVCSGIYRLTRNPMYVGFLLFLAAVAVALQSPLTLVFLPLFVWYMNTFQIRPEEEMLRAKFGTPYDDYLRKVRRWV